MRKFNRITRDRNRCGGVPCIRGLRMPVATVGGLLAEGRSDSQVLADYPDLEPEDIREALAYAAEGLTGQTREEERLGEAGAQPPSAVC